MHSINIYIVRLFALFLLGVISFNFSHLVNEFGKANSHINKLIAFFLCVLSTVFIVLIGFYLNLNLSSNLIHPNLILLTGIGYIYALITIQAALKNPSFVFNILQSVLCTVNSIAIAIFFIFYSIAPLILKIIISIFPIIFIVDLYLSIKNPGYLFPNDKIDRKGYAYMYIISYFLLFNAFGYLWIAIPFNEIMPIFPDKILPQSATKISSEKPSLKSEIGADYTKLKNLLAKQYYKASDIETRKAVTKGLGFDQDLSGIPCQDLLTIDRLWSFYSHGKFGLSIQYNIMSQIQWGETTKYNHFSDLVGWRLNGEFIGYNNLDFSENAPLGHLPFSFSRGRLNEELLRNISKCKIYK